MSRTIISQFHGAVNSCGEEYLRRLWLTGWRDSLSLLRSGRPCGCCLNNRLRVVADADDGGEQALAHESALLAPSPIWMLCSPSLVVDARREAANDLGRHLLRKGVGNDRLFVPHGKPTIFLGR